MLVCAERKKQPAWGGGGGGGFHPHSIEEARRLCGCALRWTPLPRWNRVARIDA